MGNFGSLSPKLDIPMVDLSQARKKRMLWQKALQHINSEGGFLQEKL
jgi:hypothetical protein